MSDVESTVASDPGELCIAAEIYTRSLATLCQLSVATDLDEETRQDIRAVLKAVAVRAVSDLTPMYRLEGGKVQPDRVLN